MKIRALETSQPSYISERRNNLAGEAPGESLFEAEGVLQALAGIFFPAGSEPSKINGARLRGVGSARTDSLAPPNAEARYRTLVEQIPAVIFMAFLDEGIGEAYVSPQIEDMLGFSQREWLNDPVRWYQQIHPEDKGRWSVEAARMFLSGEPLKSVYRVISREGRTVWFHCEANMVRGSDGRPWFIHGIAFDITHLKQVEEALKRAHGDLSQTNEVLRSEIAERRRAEAALGEYAQRLKLLSRRLMEVQEIERRNIARELHDEIGQALTGLKLSLEYSTHLPPDEIGASLDQAKSLVNELMQRARTLSLDLRPAMLDDIGLLPALLWHIEHYTAQTHVQVSFKHSGLDGRRFAPEVETAAYRIVQEALTNVARHANVSEVSVRVRTADHRIYIQIEDRGTGFDAGAILGSSGTSGLAGMRERAVLLGGQFTVESRPGAGTRLMAELGFGVS